MPPQKSRRTRLYIENSVPSSGFNNLVYDWIREEGSVREHSRPAAFAEMRTAYDLEIRNLQEAGETLWDAHKILLSDLTRLMFGDDISGRLAATLSAEHINPAGFRSALTQAVAKNTGENFINAITYALTACLRHQDEVLIDKGMPPPLRPLLTLKRIFTDADGNSRTINIPIEADIAIWSRSDPRKAIVINAKTRLKEVFHIATMWKLLYDMLGDPYCLTKWKLEGPPESPDMAYVFATADMIRKTGIATQGPDVERDIVRNLIAMDASFFDYVFVSKTGIGHVSSTLVITTGREALFHELGCVLDLIKQTYPGLDSNTASQP